ncbi:methyltransferase [Schizothecium vesticola]|uniref:Methyltransferase n=1 Tax=Schizothecium vesticola TaxID=314040 RepID=A0AA40EU37_9PEZI|nr:methyltransferase [Schizothecium vesticola]
MLPNLGAYWYNPFTLKIYDAWVHRFNMNRVWFCPTETVLDPLFRENFSPRHLDVGVASGYFPSAALAHRASPPTGGSQVQQITLMDLSKNSLRKARRRIEDDHAALTSSGHLSVTTAHGDVLGPVPEELQGRTFESVSMFNLLHCVPGPQDRKNQAFALAARVLADDGVLVGDTILGWRHHRPWNVLAWFEMAVLGIFGAFGNWSDTPDVFERGLKNEFGHVETRVVGSVLVFRATKPRRHR